MSFLYSAFGTPQNDKDFLHSLQLDNPSHWWKSFYIDLVYRFEILDQKIPANVRGSAMLAHSKTDMKLYLKPEVKGNMNYLDEMTIDLTRRLLPEMTHLMGEPNIRKFSKRHIIGIDLGKHGKRTKVEDFGYTLLDSLDTIRKSIYTTSVI